MYIYKWHLFNTLHGMNLYALTQWYILFMCIASVMFHCMNIYHNLTCYHIRIQYSIQLQKCYCCCLLQIFGPILPIICIDSIDDAIDLINDGYGVKIASY